MDEHRSGRIKGWIDEHLILQGNIAVGKAKILMPLSSRLFVALQFNHENFNHHPLKTEILKSRSKSSRAFCMTCAHRSSTIKVAMGGHWQFLNILQQKIY